MPPLTYRQYDPDYSVHVNVSVPCQYRVADPTFAESAFCKIRCLCDSAGDEPPSWLVQGLGAANPHVHL
jgi:hypothetical protein